jgi:hypothetical protein
MNAFPQTLISCAPLDLGLDEIVGCVSQDYFVDRELNDKSGLWTLFSDKVVPWKYGNRGNTRRKKGMKIRSEGNITDPVVERVVLVMSKGNWRYDLLKGKVILDDAIAVSPFNTSFSKWKGVPSEFVVKLNATLNDHRDLSYLGGLPEYIFSPGDGDGSIVADNNTFYTVLVEQFDLLRISEAFESLYPNLTDAVKTNLTTTQLWLVSIFFVCPV